MLFVTDNTDNRDNKVHGHWKMDNIINNYIIKFSLLLMIIFIIYFCEVQIRNTHSSYLFCFSVTN